ncbi:hypothetical protein LguiB_027930 [Lonicera macranthoides]
MAIVQQLNRNLFTANPTTTTTLTSTSFQFLFGSFLSHTMLQNRVMQSYPATYLYCSPRGSGDKFMKFTEVKFKKIRVSCTLKAGCAKVVRPKTGPNCHPFRTHADGSWSSFSIEPQLKVRFPNTSMGMNISHNGPFDSSIRFTGPYGTFTTRSFSQVPNKNGNVGVKDGGNFGRNLSFKGFHKYWKKAKPLAHRKNFEGQSASDSKISALKDADIDVSSLPISSTNQVSKAKGKAKKQSKSKTSEEQSPKPNGSTRVPQAKKLNPTQTNQCPPASKNSSTAKGPTEVLDSSVSTKPEPKKTTKSSRKKGKSTEEALANASSAAAVQPKNPNPTKNNQSSLLSKNSLPESSSVEALDSSVLEKPKSKNTTRRRKPIKEAKKLAEVPVVSSGFLIAQKHKAQKAMKSLYPPSGKSVLIVESVTKAKVIQAYLGEMFEVLPSYGHVRDLAARSGSVRPNDDFSMVWEVPSAAWTHLKSIKVALSGTQNLILASDPDREGEAIAWHIIEMLQQQDALREDINVMRVVFNEITESSIKTALQAPRDIDANLVHAYLARRALDYLIGFNISPLLWRKLPGCQSAGRVQSAALALICDREMEIDEFKPQEYWSVEVEFNKNDSVSLNNLPISSHLTHFDSKKLNQFSISSNTYAEEIEQRINSSKFEVLASKRNKMCKTPPSPYITSTLQQDGANKLHFAATYTMRLAQKLYEGVVLSDGKATGLITYIRTDGLHVSDEAAKDIHSLVKERYGHEFGSETARKYFKKVKNAQEAHEAIRPTDIRRLPSKLVGVLDEDSLKLYTLIWSRTVACQMEPAIIEQIQIDIGDAAKSIVLRSACSRVDFLGFRAVYEDLETKLIRHDDNEGNDRNDIFDILGDLKSGDPLDLGKVQLKQHHTQPPSRYSEGSLVKKLEELGIGRPSTYASTIKVLQDRNYVTMKSRALHPEFRGRMVSAFLSHHFSEVTDYSFTADMETELDNVSAGLTEWKGLLRDYWTRFSKYCERASEVHIREVEKMLEKTFADFIFASLPNKSRMCPSCREGTLIFKVSRFGAGYFIGCDQHPKCKYIAKTLYGDEDDDVTPERNSVEEPKVLGLNPGSEEKILLKNGPYGYYVQLGEDRKGYLPKRASLSQIKDVGSVTLETALDMLRYPVTLGNHPDDGQPVVLKLAKYGFSIRHRRTNAPVPKNLKPDDITFEKALTLLLSKDVKRSGRPKTKPKLEEAI